MSHRDDPLPALPELAWRTSSYSGGQGNCLEVADDIPDLIPVRDSKRPTGPVITFGRDAWRSFVTRVG